MNPKTRCKKYYIVYQTTNLITGKIYVGFHSTDDLNDSYLGSGKILKDSIKKYGKENFRREIIKVFDNKEEAEALEAEIVNEEFTSREDTYNIAIGGNVRIMVGENNPWYGKTHSKETINKIQENRNKTIQERGGYVQSTPNNYWFRFEGISFYSRSQLSEYLKVNSNSPKLKMFVYNNLDKIEFTLDSARDFFISWYNNYEENRAIEKLKLTERTSKRFKGKPKPAEQRKKMSDAGLGRETPWMQDNNRNPEKIRKTADKHRGMKRSDDAKINIKLAQDINFYFKNADEFSEIMIKGIKYKIITPFGAFLSLNQIPEGHDKKKVVMLSYLGYHMRSATGPMRTKYKEYIITPQIGTLLKTLGWDMVKC